MKPAPFEYCRPASLQETFDLLDRYGEDGRLLAGGQSLVPTPQHAVGDAACRHRHQSAPWHGRDPRGVRRGLAIGALVRQETLERSTLVAEHAPLIAAAMPHVGHSAIRARGTLGGSLALADPAAELPACAVALGAILRIASRRGAREVPAADFFRGIYTTALAPGEVLAEVVVPRAAGWRWGLEELARRHGDFALAGLAAGLSMNGQTVAAARLVFFGVGTRPVRAAGAEAALTGRSLDAAALDAAARALDGDLDPPEDIHGSPALRRHLARVLLGRVATRLAEASP